MYCLMCGMEKGDGDFVDILENDDPLCHRCRNNLNRVRFRMKFHGYKLYASYVYDDTFAKILVQYKECFDEALKTVFLYPLRWWFMIRFFGYTVCYLPSSKEKIAKRGFHHLEKMFSSIPLQQANLFEKVNDFDQKNRSVEERMKMVDNIALKKHCDIPKKVLLVDDTITTGASLLGALRCLQDYDCKIAIYVVSVNHLWLKKPKIFGK
jgi:hypothetical protein